MVICDICRSDDSVVRCAVGLLREADPGSEPRYFPTKGHRPLRMDLCQSCLGSVIIVVEAMVARIKGGQLDLAGGEGSPK